VSSIDQSCSTQSEEAENALVDVELSNDANAEQQDSGDTGSDKARGVRVETGLLKEQRCEKEDKIAVENETMISENFRGETKSNSHSAQLLEAVQSDSQERSLSHVFPPDSLESVALPSRPLCSYTTRRRLHQFFPFIDVLRIYEVVEHSFGFFASASSK
jgi:hypothetical protein